MGEHFARRRFRWCQGTWPTRWTRALLGLLLGAVLVVGPALPAPAHAGLVGSDPAEGAVLAATPRQVRLVFSAPVSADGTTIEVDAGGRSVGGTPSAIDSTVLVELAQDAGTGTFTVRWRARALDTHVTTGQFTFSVGPPSGGGAAPASIATATSPAGRPEGFRLTEGGAIRILEVTGITLLAGLLAAQAWLSGRRRRMARLVSGGVLGLVASWLAATSHASDTPQHAVTAILLAVHVLCMSVWAGGVLMLAVLPRHSGAGADVIGRFSQWAVIAVPIGLLAGVFTAVNETGSLRYLLTPSAFTIVLAIKAALALLAMGLAWRFWSGGRAAGLRRPRARLVLGLESGVLFAALFASSVLAQTDPLSSWTSSTTAVKVGARVAVASCPVRSADRLTCRVQLFVRSGAHDVSVRVVSVQLTSGTRATRRLDLQTSGGAVRFSFDEGLTTGPWDVHLDYQVTEADTGSASFPVTLG